jgi:hypothetical protein
MFLRLPPESIQGQIDSVYFDISNASVIAKLFTPLYVGRLDFTMSTFVCFTPI